MGMLETLLQNIGAVKTDTIEGKVIAHGVLGKYLLLGGPKEGLERKIVDDDRFFYLVESEDKVIGVFPNAKYNGIYPGNGSTVRFKAYVGGWLPGNPKAASHKVGMPRGNGWVNQDVDFYRAEIYPEFVEPYTQD